MIKVNELFAGIGAFRKALERLNIPHEIVGKESTSPRRPAQAGSTRHLEMA